MFIFSERMRAFVVTGENAMFCTQCGSRVSNATNFCGSCGANVCADVESAAAPAKATVGQASSAVELKTSQAQSRAAAVPASVPAGPQPSSFSGSHRVKKTALGATIALVVLAGGYWGWSNFAAHSTGANAGPNGKTAVGQPDQTNVAHQSVEQAEIAAAQAALDREIAAEESAAKEQAQLSAAR
jgi:hypothetical protein